MIGGAFGVTLAHARTGDEAAFACIFRDVQPALLRYLRVIAAEPEDVAGETWIQVVTGLRRFRGGEQDFRAWLFAIARNRAADAGRSRHRRPSVPLDMIFIRADGTIARIATAVPHSLDSVSSLEPVVAVLEIAAGRAAQLGIREGDRVGYTL